jgi:hypothetical protein
MFRVAGFELDLLRAELRGPDGVPIKLRRKPFEMLALFAANAGRILGKQELTDAVWPNVHTGPAGRGEGGNGQGLELRPGSNAGNYPPPTRNASRSFLQRANRSCARPSRPACRNAETSALFHLADLLHRLDQPRRCRSSRQSRMNRKRWP